MVASATSTGPTALAAADAMVKAANVTIVGREGLPVRAHPENVRYLRTKRDRMEHLLHHQGLALDEELDLQRDAMRELGFGDDYREGVAAFMEKRKPNFTGK